jgi:hypothetical protein
VTALSGFLTLPTMNKDEEVRNCVNLSWVLPRTTQPKLLVAPEVGVQAETPATLCRLNDDFFETL